MKKILFGAACIMLPLSAQAQMSPYQQQGWSNTYPAGQCCGAQQQMQAPAPAPIEQTEQQPVRTRTVYKYRKEEPASYYRPYLALRGGASYVWADLDFGSGNESWDDVTSQGRVALGLNWAKHFRTEVEANLFWSMHDTKFSKGPGRARKNMYLQTYMLNAYWDFNYAPESVVYPFIGAGVGLAHVKTKIVESGNSSEAANAFSAMGTLGVAFKLSRNVTFELAGRYTFINDNDAAEKDIHAVSADAGLRFAF